MRLGMMRSSVLRRSAVSRDAPAVAAETDHLFGELVTLALHQFVGMSAQPRRFQRQLARRPCASRLARAQAGAGLGHVSTIWHMPMGLDDFAQRFINYLDGTHTLSMLTERMLDDIVDGRLALAQPIADRACLGRPGGGELPAAVGYVAASWHPAA